jgi:protein gp37
MSTKIEWCDDTWNPWWGCDPIAEECDKCYAAIFAGRGLHAVHAGVAKGGKWTGLITRSGPKVWHQPFLWRKPMLIFTCSMSDFWHERVPLEWLDEALTVIEATPHITYLILSKRPGNAARKLAALGRQWPANGWAGATIGHPKSLPLLRPLLRIPAEKRFLSIEPLLAPLPINLTGIDWVLVGGESGQHPRPCDPDWVRALRDQSVGSGIPFFMKQWGDWANNPTPREQELDEHAKGGATLDRALWREYP